MVFSSPLFLACFLPALLGLYFLCPAKGRNAVLTVYNTGEGIPADKLEKIFDRFYRGDASHNSEVAGNGLGLSIARTIVDAHKGKIHAESREGKDAAFIVTLPQ